MRICHADISVFRWIAHRMREWDRQEIFALQSHDDPDRFSDYASHVLGETSWTAHLSDGRPVAAFGAYERWPGRWSVWMFGTDDVPKIGLGLTKHVKRHVTPALERLGMVQADCYSLDGHVFAQNWLRALGFVEHSRLESYGRSGETFLRFVWQK